MIKYRLICSQDHEFDGWFAGSKAFDAQVADSEIACPLCANTDIRKALMAPSVVTSKRSKKHVTPSETVEQVQMFMSKVRAHVESNFDYVGDQFADEARRIHYGEADEREIYGEATLDEAQDLVEEGVSVAPLPMTPDPSKAN
ncbi:MAG: hypothetical protein COA62_08870 [Rhodobiaceae bacterium]|nr:MAG: hypothetical protein COA62_08870 [Rhodobiaceae bacterium]